MTVFNGSAFFERTLRGRFREKNIFKTVQTVEKETVEAQFKLYKFKPLLRVLFESNRQPQKKTTQNRSSNHQQPTCAPHLNTSLILTHLQ